MKTIKIIIAITFFTMSTANAQITKGNWMVGGSGSFSYGKTEKINNSSSTGSTIDYTSLGVYTILLEPNIGYFIKDKLAIGLKLNVFNSFSEGEPFEIGDSNVGISPHFRYYFLKEDKVYNLFVEPSYYYLIDKDLGNASGFGLKSGLPVFLNSSVAIEPSLNYVYRKSESFKTNEFFVGIGVKVHLEKEQYLT